MSIEDHVEVILDGLGEEYCSLITISVIKVRSEFS